MTAPLSKLLLKLPSVLSHDTAAPCIESLREQCVQFFAFDASSPSQGAFTVEVDADLVCDKKYQSLGSQSHAPWMKASVQY